ncbi:MAG: DedA family protein [Coriobacteriia bacterium]
MNTWGYVLTAAFTVSENLFIIGSFTPGETVVIAAAFLSAPENGNLSLTAVWFSSMFGTIAGSNISYWFGRKGGRDTLVRYGRRFRINEERLAAAEAYFYRHGSKTVFLSRFAPGFKNFVPVIAGMSKMHIVYFEGWTLLSAVAYTTAMCAIGRFVGENFDRALTIAQSLGYFGLALFVIVLGLALFGRRRFVAHRRDDLLDEYAEELADEWGPDLLRGHILPDEDDESAEYAPARDTRDGDIG